jgi:hypothetical protein
MKPGLFEADYYSLSFFIECYCNIVCATLAAKRLQEVKEDNASYSPEDCILNSRPCQNQKTDIGNFI